MTLRTGLTIVLLAAAAFIVWILANGGIGITAQTGDCATGPMRETSADYLQRRAHCIYGESEAKLDMLRLALIDDIFIKSWSYAVLNKICFWASIGLALMVLVYPALGPILSGNPPREGEDTPPQTWLQRAVSTSAVQTSITALAAATFAFYAHYKERQSIAETLMRELMVREAVDEAYMAEIVQRMAQMDKGFGFATTQASQEQK